MLFQEKSKTTPDKIKVQIFGQKIKETQQTEHIGLLTDNKLS